MFAVRRLAEEPAVTVASLLPFTSAITIGLEEEPEDLAVIFTVAEPLFSKETDL